MDTAAGRKQGRRRCVFLPHCPFTGARTRAYDATNLCLKMYLQVSRQPGHNQQLPGSHVVDLHHLPHHRIRGHGPKHVLREGSLPPDRHHGESGVSETPLLEEVIKRCCFCVVLCSCSDRAPAARPWWWPSWQRNWN